MSDLSALPGNPTEILLKRFPDPINARRQEMSAVIIQELIPNNRPAKLRIAKNIDGIDVTDIIGAARCDLRKDLAKIRNHAFNLGTWPPAALATYSMAIIEDDAIHGRRLKRRHRPQEQDARPRRIELRNEVTPQRDRVRVRKTRRHDHRDATRRVCQQLSEWGIELLTAARTNPGEPLSWRFFRSQRRRQEERTASAPSHIDQREAKLVEATGESWEHGVGERIAHQHRHILTEAVAWKFRVI